MTWSLASLSVYWAFFGLAWLGITLAWWYGARMKNLPTRGRTTAMGVLGLAALVRIGLLLTGPPLLSDDIYRYMLDGEMLRHGQNPYRLSPAELQESQPQVPAHARQLAAHVNHPELTTVYQPTSQWLFAAVALTRSQVQPGKPLNPLIFQLGFVLIDLWLIALLLIKLRRIERSAWWAALYALHPLAITEFAIAGHQDILGIVWLLMTFMLIDQRGLFSFAPEAKIGTLRALLAGGAFALAIGVKPIVLPLALPLAVQLMWRQREPRALGAAVIASLVTLAALYLPFYLMEGGLEGMVETGGHFAQHWSFNGAIYIPLKNLLIFPSIARTLCTLVLLVVLVRQTLRSENLYTIALTYFFLGLLLSSTAHPWYLLWALPFMAVQPRSLVAPAVWVWSLTISLSYIALIDPEQYEVPWPVLVLEYLPALCVLVYGMLRRRSS